MENPCTRSLTDYTAPLSRNFPIKTDKQDLLIEIRETIEDMVCTIFDEIDNEIIRLSESTDNPLNGKVVNTANLRMELKALRYELIQETKNLGFKYINK